MSFSFFLLLEPIYYINDKLFQSFQLLFMMYGLLYNLSQKEERAVGGRQGSGKEMYLSISILC